MMEELLTRRLKMIESDPEPDLIVIDGGKGQLGMACGVLEKRWDPVKNVFTRDIEMEDTEKE